MPTSAFPNQFFLRGVDRTSEDFGAACLEMGRAKARPIPGREAAPKQKRSQREALLTPVQNQHERN